MQKLLFMACAVLLMAASCSKSKTENNDCGGASSFVLNEPFLLCFGTTAFQTGHNFNIKFENVAEDSRCPIDGVCVWEGRALIALTLSHEGTVETDSVAVGNFSGMPYSDSILFDGYKIKLLDVLPAPVSTNQTTEEDYKVKLLITN